MNVQLNKANKKANPAQLAALKSQANNDKGTDAVTIEKDATLEPTDTVEKSEEEHHSFRWGRTLRKAALSAASTGAGLLSAVTSIPEGIKIGLDTKNGVSDEQKRLNAAHVSTVSSVVSSALIGAATFGPIGLAVGGVLGYISGTMSNHLKARSGVGAQKVGEISKTVEKAVGDSESVWGTAKAVAAGAYEGVVQGYKTRKMTSKIQMSGMMDGVADAIEDAKESRKQSKPTQELADDDRSPVTKAAMTAAGVMFGAAGVMINAPGGAVIGSLESLKETSNYFPSKMEKSTMLWATNVGKFLPAATIAAAVGGPVGIAASTLVGVATASVASMVDGRYGVNKKIARPVEKAVKEAHGEESVKENLRAYYRAGKGSVVGLSAGVREGWKAGFQGGVDMVRDAVEAAPEAVEVEADNENKDAAKKQS